MYKGLDKIKLEVNTHLELAMKRGLETVRSKTVPLVPVKTGRLKGSLQGFNAGISGGSQVGGGDAIYKIETTKIAIIGYIGTNVPYAKFVEYGTSRMSGKHYLTSGFEIAKPYVLGIFQKTIQSVLK